MPWNVYFFETSRGEKVVREFISGLRQKTIAKVAHGIDLLEIHGPVLGMPYSKKITKEIYELRIRGENSLRILYACKGMNIYLLHAFKKKTQKTPPGEIRLAEKRWRKLDC